MATEKLESEKKETEIDSDDQSDSFKIPEEKTVDELLNADKDDEALNKYKATLLGDTDAASKELRFKVDKLELVIENGESISDEVNKEIVAGSKDVVVDVKKEHSIKEGTPYTSNIYLTIESGLLFGLKCLQRVYRAGIQVHKELHVVGSFSVNQKSTPCRITKEVAPTGMLARGSYKISNTFQDDDKKVKFEIITRLNITK